MRRTLIALAATLILAVAAAAPAGATSYQDVINDCSQHSQLTQHYDAAVLRAALAHLNSLSAEYGDCYDAIQRALLADAGQGGSGGSGSLLPTWAIILIVVLVAGAAGFGTVAVRRRQGAPEESSPDAGADEPPSEP